MYPNDTTNEVHYDFITLGKDSIDMTGQRFGRLVALGPVGKTRGGVPLWLCRCDCGNTATIGRGDLRSMKTKSCGCLAIELQGSQNKTHGLSYTPIYRRWRQIITRCTNPNSKDFAYYAARGISICDEWKHSFQVFHDHVSKLPYYDEKGYTLERIDNDAGYFPGNVRWATRAEQNLNTRQNHRITFNGETKTLGEWAHEIGIEPSSLAGRLKTGWSVERAVTQPPKKR